MNGAVAKNVQLGLLDQTMIEYLLLMGYLALGSFFYSRQHVITWLIIIPSYIITNKVNLILGKLKTFQGE